MKEKSEIVLASASPRRLELLSQVVPEFSVVAADIHEKPWPNEKPASYALRNAHEKAFMVSSKSDNRNSKIVIAADTIVVLSDEILEKPSDTADAKRMLRALSGRDHEVITGLCVRRAGVERGEAVKTVVTFRDLTDQEIDDYIATGEPMDKAGAYAIQGGAGCFVSSVRGSYSNVIGLPLDELKAVLALFQRK